MIKIVKTPSGSFRVTMVVIFLFIQGCAPIYTPTFFISDIKYKDKERVQRFDYKKIKPGAPVKVSKTNGERIMGRFIKLEKYQLDEYKTRFNKALAILENDQNETRIPVLNDNLIVTLYPENVVGGVFVGLDFDLDDLRNLMIINSEQDSCRKSLNLEKIRSVQFIDGTTVTGRSLRTLLDQSALPLLSSFWMSTVEGDTIAYNHTLPFTSFWLKGNSWRKTAEADTIVLGLEEISGIAQIKIKYTPTFLGRIYGFALGIGLAYGLLILIFQNMEFDIQYDDAPTSTTAGVSEANQWDV